MYNQLVTKKVQKNNEAPEDQKTDKKSKWREEREKFIQAVRLGREINKLEKDPNVNNDESIQIKIR